MQILFLVSAHNNLSQRAWIALTELGYDVSVAVVDTPASIEAALQVHAPDLIVCPFLKTRDPRIDLATALLPDRPSRPTGRSWPLIPRLGDRAGEVRVGGDCSAGHRRVRRRGGVGDNHVHDAQGGQEQPVRERGSSRGDRGDLRGARPSRADRGGAVADGSSGQRSARAMRAADDFRRSAGSIGSPTAPSACCGRYAPATGILACSTRSPERTFTSSAAIRNGRSVAGRANCWHSETARSAVPRSTGRCG